LFDVPLIQKTQNFFLELSAAFAGNDLHQRDLPVNGFLHDAVQFRIDLVSAVVDLMQVEFQLCHYFFAGRKSNGGRWFSFIKCAPISLTCSAVSEPVSHPSRWN